MVFPLLGLAQHCVFEYNYINRGHSLQDAGRYGHVLSSKICIDVGSHVH